VPVLDFEADVQKLIPMFTLPKEFSEFAIKWLKKLHKQEVKERTLINKNFQESYNDIQKQLDELLNMRLGKLIDDNEYQAKKTALMQKKKAAKASLEHTDKRADDWMDLYERTFNFAAYASVWFDKGSNEQKRAILHALGSNMTLDGKKLLIKQHKPFMILNGMQENIEIVLQTFGTEELLDLASQSSIDDPQILNLLSIVDYVRTYYSNLNNNYVYFV